ncbi:PAS domain S-box protein [Bacillus sp. FJAT-29814]|uniref:PAS domain S-box protein n=1 Tax=Bacillus sp. FJAT-29814 TaxID=1729688 RepID=UPI00082B9A93|nr:PAS domain S-box protein [Bacillus sp. FJAT-29814]
MNSPVENLKSEKQLLLKKYADERISNNEVLINENKDAICYLDLEGYVVKVNPTFEKLTGYSAAEALHMKKQQFFSLDCLDRLFHACHKATLGRVQNFDCQMQTKDGAFVDVNVTNIPIGADNKIIGICLVARDISHIKKKKAEVREIEEFHRVLTENVLDVIVCTNLLGKIVYISPSCEMISGFTPEEVVGKSYSELIYPEDLDLANTNHNISMTLLENTRGNYRVRKKDGELIWIETLSKPIVDPETNTVVEVVSVFRDITERIKAEEDLWSRKRAFRDLVEHSPDAVVITDFNDILFINETGFELLGAETSDEILAKRFLDFIHPVDHRKAREMIETVHNGDTIDFQEYKITRMDDTFFDAEIKGIPTYFNNQSAQHIIIRDITERKKTQDLLLHSEKLSVAGQLAAGIAHEVRNPLTAIKGFLQLMEVQLDNKAYVEIIQSEIERIELILSELLVLSKPQESKIETVDLILLIEEIKTLIDTQAIMNNVLIYIETDFKQLLVNCDKNQLKQVFINFFKNSIEAMPDGGTVTVELKRVGTDKVKIFFKDTGVGIPPHVLKRIGEPFFTTKEGGTGLGIMISKQIIENHHGSVHFWSDDQGTIIEVILPVG